jgi:16S rRNA processing protein RimM
MIHPDINDFMPVGTIVKPHGLKGELVIESDEGYEDAFIDSEYLLIEVEGGLVPFFITDDGVHFRTSTTMTLTFDDIDSVEKVRSLCGCRVFLQKNAGTELSSGDDFNELIGFTVIDTAKGELGKITRIDDFSGNVVLTIQHGSIEILIPLSEELITEYAEEKRQLFLDCPDGLIDLYLEG